MRKRGLSAQNTLLDTEGINLTPLIDVVFVVLIMFIIIAPMLELDRIELAGKEKKDNSQSFDQQHFIRIYVHADNTIWVNQKLVSIEELRKYVQKAKLQKPDQIPQIFHDKKAEFGTYQSIKNALEGAGFEQMDIILQPS